MTDRPISVRDFEVKALLAGRKTQKRVVLNPQPNVSWIAGGYGIGRSGFPGEWTRTAGKAATDTEWARWVERVTARFSPGDRLWVRETWAVGNVYDGVPPRDFNPGGKPNWCGIRYAATDARCDIKDRPSIHMPRWASRITLLVEAVRVERLQDISEADAIAEGIHREPHHWDDCEYPLPPVAYRALARSEWRYSDSREAYRELWTSLHGPDAWEANPWLVAVTFRPVLANIDAMEGG